MRVHCPACRRVLNIPDDRAANPALKVKCPCGSVFPLQEASLAFAAPTPAAAPQAALPVRAPAPAATGAHAPQTATPAPARSSPPARAPSPPGASTPSAPAGPASSAAAARPSGGAWRRCANHAQARSAHVCQACGKGFCAACVKEVRGAFPCPSCDGLCTPAARIEEQEQKDRQRARPLMEELGTIGGYPLVEPVAYLMLSIAVGVFALAKGMSLLAVVFSDGLLMAYAFSAVNRVSQGNLRSFMPAISDVMDLVLPLRLGFVAFLAANLPLLALFFLGPPIQSVFGFELASAQPAAVVHAQVQEAQPVPDAEEPAFDEEAPVDGEDETGAESQPEPGSTEEPFTPEKPGAGWGLLYVLAILWRLVYAPVALTGAVLSSTAGLLSSSLQTLNPVLGIATIWRMGRTYWEALLVYTVIVFAQFLISLPLGLIPIAGTLLRAFVDCYANLCIGCTLGLAVFKKARELGMD
jgi:hypothetical protein